MEGFFKTFQGPFVIPLSVIICSKHLYRYVKQWKKHPLFLKKKL